MAGPANGSPELPDFDELSLGMQDRFGKTHPSIDATLLLSSLWVPRLTGRGTRANRRLAWVPVALISTSCLEVVAKPESGNSRSGSQSRLPQCVAYSTKQTNARSAEPPRENTRVPMRHCFWVPCGASLMWCWGRP